MVVEQLRTSLAKRQRRTKMCCSTKSLKCVLYAINFQCLLLGSLLIWYGVWLLNSLDEVHIDHGERLAAILIVLLGTVILAVVLFGCVAAFKQSKEMLIIFAVILIVLLIIQVTLVSISYTASSEGVSEALKKGFDEMWEDERMTHTNSTLSQYEEWLQCCGKLSAEDYFVLEKIPPPSCCKERDCTNVLNLYTTGCEQKFKEYISSKTYYLNILSWLLIVIEFTGSVFACMLADSIRDRRDRVRFYS